MGLFDTDDGNDDEADAPDADATAGFEPADRITPHPPGESRRVVDSEAGVVIYATNGANGYGLAAVPLAETDLDEA